jgi:hypothetical protein
MKDSDALNNLIKNALIGKPLYKVDDKTEAVVDMITTKILYRIAGALTNYDMLHIQLLDKDDQKGYQVYNFLLGKIANLDVIITEEIELLKTGTQ